nr:PREDICTED: putative transporter SVOPL [Equus przewalskii]
MATKQTEPVTVISLRKLSLGTPEPQQKEPKTFTVEEAVETIGFGRFHIALFLIMGSTGVFGYEQMNICVCMLWKFINHFKK